MKEQPLIMRPGSLLSKVISVVTYFKYHKIFIPLFTNDLATNLSFCNSIMFADDTTLYKTHSSLRYLKWSIEQDMSVLLDWFKANKLTLNLEKTSCILLKKSGNKQEIQLEIDGIGIASTSHTKFLGLWLDSHLNWSLHLSQLFTKLKRNKALLR